MKPKAAPSIGLLRRALKAAARPQRVAELSAFFKTGPGEYAEGDRFIGVSVPEMRRIAATGDGLQPEDVLPLLHSRIHEERMLALMVWVRVYPRGDDPTRARIFQLYLRERKWINNWDLVDVSAYHIVGAHLLDRPRGQLDRMARSPHLWTRRIAVVSTYAFIRRGQTADIFRLSKILLGDGHDLMHKACGWMLREAGKREPDALRKFLRVHTPCMPRTMLRYAIEKFSPAERREWLAVPRALKSR
ncbi:MAG: DNA alkylation repair protein [Candidatus Methylacidiphilales bacterium]|nr:DNA alkylation repair protein [Candidatus Methylacidiphilales bacterium]